MFLKIPADVIGDKILSEHLSLSDISRLEVAAVRNREIRQHILESMQKICLNKNNCCIEVTSDNLSSWIQTRRIPFTMLKMEFRQNEELTIDGFFNLIANNNNNTLTMVTLTFLRDCPNLVNIISFLDENCPQLSQLTIIIPWTTQTVERSIDIFPWTFPNLNILNLRNCHLSYEACVSILMLPILAKIYFHRCSLGYYSSPNDPCIRYTSNIKSIYLYQVNYSDRIHLMFENGFSVKFPLLTELRLFIQTYIGDDLTRAITFYCPSLRILDLGRTLATSLSLRNIEQKYSPVLEEFRIMSPFVDDIGLQCLSHCHALTCLHIKFSAHFTDAGLFHIINGCYNLVELVYKGYSATSEVLYYMVNKLPHLRRLTIEDCPNLSLHAIHAVVEGCPNIESIRFIGCNITDSNNFLFARQVAISFAAT